MYINSKEEIISSFQSDAGGVELLERLEAEINDSVYDLFDLTEKNAPSWRTTSKCSEPERD